MGKRSNNKVVLVTEIGRDIGKAIAIGYSEEGAKIELPSRTKEKLLEVYNKIKKLYRDCLIVKAEISKEAETGDLIKTTI